MFEALVGRLGQRRILLQFAEREVLAFQPAIAGGTTILNGCTKP
jgi:hypothetical protein